MLGETACKHSPLVIYNLNQFSVLCADYTAQRFALNLFLLLVDSFSTSPSRNLLRLEYSIKSKNYLCDSFTAIALR